MEKNLYNKICELVNQVPFKERGALLDIVFKSMEDEINLPESEQDTMLKYALREFNIAFPGWKEDEMQRCMCMDILNLIKIFSRQGHSGFSAGYLIPKLTRLLKFEPLTKLTFGDDEFNDNQNSRLSSVFKDQNGKYHYLYAYFMRENYHIFFDNSHNISHDEDVSDKNFQYSGGFPLVIMNDGTIAKVSHVYVKDTETFDWTKKHQIDCVSICNKDWWESFTTEEYLRKVEQDYEVVYKIFNNPTWEDLGRDNRNYELFGDFSNMIDKVKPYVEKMRKCDYIYHN